MSTTLHFPFPSHPASFSPLLQWLKATDTFKLTCTHVQLNPMTKDDIADVFRAILGSVPDPLLVTHAEAITGGNPFWVTAMAKSVAMSGAKAWKEASAPTRRESQRDLDGASSRGGMKERSTSIRSVRSSVGSAGFADQACESSGAEAGGGGGSSGEFATATSLKSVGSAVSMGGGAASLLSRFVVEQFDGQEWEAQTVLKAASAIGTEFSVEILSKLIETRLRRKLPSLLAALDVAEFVEPCVSGHGDVSDGSGEWRFQHDLMREALYSLASQQQKKKWHRKIAMTIENIYQDPSPHFMRIAEHYRLARATAESFKATANALRASLTLGAMDEVVNIIDLALDDATSIDDVTVILGVVQSSISVEKNKITLELKAASTVAFESEEERSNGPKGRRRKSSILSSADSQSRMRLMRLLESNLEREKLQWGGALVEGEGETEGGKQDGGGANVKADGVPQRAELSAEGKTGGGGTSGGGSGSGGRIAAATKAKPTKFCSIS